MKSSGLSKARLGRMREVMAGHVLGEAEGGTVPGLVALVSRRGEVHVEAIGLQEVGGRPMRRDTIFRVASLSKPIAAVAALILVEECRLRLDEPVDRLLPELADRKVLRRLDGPLDDTVPARRPITLRDLLTLRMGIGHIMKPSKGWPIKEALRERKLLQGPPRPQSLPGPDEWMRQVAELPLMHQPGEEWMYDLAMDVLGVLIARAADQPLETFLRERIFDPLGMKDTGFSVPPEKIDRLATSYQTDHATGELRVYDPAEGGEWSRPPAFPAASGGLVSTADDYLAFGRMMLDFGRHEGKAGSGRLLSRLSVEAMTTDQLTPRQREAAFSDDNRSWGLGVAVVVRRDQVSAVPGRFGWEGGLGTSWASDPREELIGLLLTQVNWDSPAPPEVWTDFWTSVYQAIDD